LLRPSNPPAGLAIQQTAAGTADASGAIAQPIEITAPVTGQNAPSEATQISVEQGSVLRDANGVALQGGITAITRTLNPNEPAAMGTVDFAELESILPADSFWQIESSTSIGFRDASGRIAATVTGSQQSKEMGSVANVECIAELSRNRVSSNPNLPISVMVLYWRQHEILTHRWILFEPNNSPPILLDPSDLLAYNQRLLYINTN
jgi:hypothetical protein